MSYQQSNDGFQDERVSETLFLLFNVCVCPSGVAANCASALAQMAAASCVQEEKEEKEVAEAGDAITQGSSACTLYLYHSHVFMALSHKDEEAHLQEQCCEFTFRQRVNEFFFLSFINTLLLYLWVHHKDAADAWSKKWASTDI